jgi:hypothetical protein
MGSHLGEGFRHIGRNSDIKSACLEEQGQSSPNTFLVIHKEKPLTQGFVRGFLGMPSRLLV